METYPAPPKPLPPMLPCPAPRRIEPRLDLLLNTVRDLDSYVHSATHPWVYGTTVHVRTRVKAIRRLVDLLVDSLPERIGSR